jgi:mono/diheme cytochrome c family protein
MAAKSSIPLACRLGAGVALVAGMSCLHTCALALGSAILFGGCIGMGSGPAGPEAPPPAAGGTPATPKPTPSPAPSPTPSPSPSPPVPTAPPDAGSDGASTSGTPVPTGLQIVAVAGAAGTTLTAAAGDALALKVVHSSAGGAPADLPAGLTVTWSGAPTITAAAPGGTAATPLPAPGTHPTAMFIHNPGRPEHDLTGILFVLDAGTRRPGSLTISATVAGAGPSATVKATIAVTAPPVGDATRGQTLYMSQCAQCHGLSGGGTLPLGTTGTAATTYVMGGQSYDFPAPPLNASPGALAADPTWNASLLAMASRADMDNTGVTLRVPMPGLMADSTQDFADIYAFLKTQKQ